MAITQTAANKGGISHVGEDTADTVVVRMFSWMGLKFGAGAGDPNTFATAPKGSIWFDDSAPNVWQNDDGVTSWEKVGLQS